MDINDASVLEMLNQFISINRFNKIQILQIVKLVPVSNSFDELKENVKWENITTKYKINTKNQNRI